MNHRRRRIVPAVLASLTALAAGACSSAVSGNPSTTPPAQTVASTAAATPPAPSTSAAAATTTAPTAAQINPCSLVTKAEADKLAGVRMQPAVRALQTCTFATPTSGAVGQLEVYVGDGAKKFLDIDRVDLGHKFHTVRGIGDEAHIEDGAIFFKVGDVWLGLRLLRLDDVNTRPTLEALARTVASRV